MGVQYQKYVAENEKKGTLDYVYLVSGDADLTSDNLHCFSAAMFGDVDPEKTKWTVAKTVAHFFTNFFITKIVFADLILRTVFVIEGGSVCPDFKRAYHRNVPVNLRSWASRRFGSNRSIRTSIQQNDGQENGNHSVRIYDWNDTVMFPVPIPLPIANPPSIREVEDRVEGNDVENPHALFPEDH